MEPAARARPFSSAVTVIAPLVVALGKENSPMPPEPPVAMLLDWPSPEDAATAPRDSPPGPVIRWVPAGNVPARFAYSA